MAFAPDYETSGVFYLSYTNNAGKSEVRRYTVSGNPDVANTSGTLVISVDDFASQPQRRPHRLRARRLPLLRHRRRRRRRRPAGERART